MRLCIVGTSRCGTTLTRALLHEHPQLSLFNETHWLPKMHEIAGRQPVHWRILHDIASKTTWDTGKDLYSVNAALAGYKSKDELISHLKRLLKAREYLTIQQFSEAFAEACFGSGASWGDKTPDYGFYMRLLQDLWPQCRFLHVVRDGVHTALSMSKHPGIQLMVSAGYDNWCPLSYDGAYKKYTHADLPLEAYVASWRKRLDRIREESRGLKPGTYLEIRYEALLRESRTTLEKIAQWLELDTDSAWLERAALIVRPPTAKAASELHFLCRLSPADLRCLNREGSLAGLEPLPDDASEMEIFGMLRRGYTALDRGDFEGGIRAGISILACRSGQPQHLKEAEILIARLRGAIQ